MDGALRAIPWPRAVVATMLLAVIVGGPPLRHLLHVGGPWLPAWNMYRTGYTRICVADFVQRIDGRDVRIDRWSVLERGPWYAATQDVRNLDNRQQVVAEARALCGALGVGTDVRADARCGHHDGWRPVFAREQDLCAP